MDEHARYRVIGRLGRGGSADVERVLDTRLGRILARKRLRCCAEDDPHAAEPFAAEARLQARLQHPGVVPVHELGLDEHGRPCFTLAEVRGRTLQSAIRDLHQVSSAEGWGQTPDGLSLRRLVQAVARIAETVAFAHTEGVVHRDLKPANVMLGPSGELLLLDWGIARPVGDAVRRVEGTPAYMAPEVASRRAQEVSPAVDLFGLGAMLYELLSGRPPYTAPTPRAALAEAAACSPPPPGRPGGPLPPAELVALAARAMSPRAEDRPAQAMEVARALLAWLDGVARQEEALRLVAEAAARLDRGREAAQEAGALAARAAEVLAGVAGWEPEARKRPGWALEDAARERAQAALLGELQAEDLLETALTLAPDCVEARAALADLHREALRRADAARDARAVSESAARLDRDLAALPAGHPAQVAGRALLADEGWLTLATDPPGAEVIVERYVERGRRLVPVEVGRLGQTPILEARLPAGSYRLRLRRDGHHEALYPVLIQRGERWTGAPDPEGDAHPVALLPLGTLTDDQVYVPAGPALCEGDPLVSEAGPLRWIWLPGFAIERDPFTLGRLVQALNQMMAEGAEALALAVAPQISARTGHDGELLVRRDGEGRWFLDRADPGQRPDLPVAMVDHAGATALAAWHGARSGRVTRLPSAMEWEKAARGVDGRRYPMGDLLIPAWTWCAGSAPAVVGPELVTGLERDVSPYGLRGASGNVRTWCSERAPDGSVMVVGGDWLTDSRRPSLGRIFREHAVSRLPVLGLRIVMETGAESLNVRHHRNSS